jgi:hypothetical protein
MFFYLIFMPHCDFAASFFHVINCISCNNLIEQQLICECKWNLHRMSDKWINVFVCFTLMHFKLIQICNKFQAIEWVIVWVARFFSAVARRKKIWKFKYDFQVSTPWMIISCSISFMQNQTDIRCHLIIFNSCEKIKIKSWMQFYTSTNINNKIKIVKTLNLCSKLEILIVSMKLLLCESGEHD